MLDAGVIHSMDEYWRRYYPKAYPYEFYNDPVVIGEKLAEKLLDELRNTEPTPEQRG